MHGKIKAVSLCLAQICRWYWLRVMEIRIFVNSSLELLPLSLSLQCLLIVEIASHCLFLGAAQQGSGFLPRKLDSVTSFWSLAMLSEK